MEETAITTSAARKKLAPRRKPYYRRLQQNVHVGYRKNGRESGSWVLRYYLGKQKYEVERFATAIAEDSKKLPDKQAIEGAKVDELLPITYDQAVEVGRWRYQQRQLGKTQGKARPITVREAVEQHIERNRLEGKSADVNEDFANAHIYDQLGDIEVSKLTTTQIRRWRNALAKSPRRLRSKNGAPPRYAEPPKTDEEKRARKDTANRVYRGVLRPALQAAFEDDENNIPSDAAWRKVKPIKNTSRSRKDFLDTTACERLLNVCESEDPNLRNLVQAALFTGARYGELCALNVSDWKADLGKVHIRDSKSGRERYITVNEAGRKFFDYLVAGRDGREPLLRKADGSRWAPGHQIRPFKAAVKRAKISPPISFHHLRHTFCTLSLMSGVPRIVLADALGHTSVRMIEATYSHIPETHSDKELRGKTPTFALPEGVTRVVGMKG